MEEFQMQHFNTVWYLVELVFVMTCTILHWRIRLWLCGKVACDFRHSLSVVLQFTTYHTVYIGTYPFDLLTSQPIYLIYKLGEKSEEAVLDLLFRFLTRIRRKPSQQSASCGNDELKKAKGFRSSCF